MKQRELSMIEPFLDILPAEKAGTYWTVKFSTGYALRTLLEEHLAKSKRHDGLATFLAEYSGMETADVIHRVLTTLVKRFKDDRWFGDRTAQSYGIYDNTVAQVDAAVAVLISQEVGQFIRRPASSDFVERTLPLTFSAVRRHIVVNFSQFLQQLEDRAVLDNHVEVDKIDEARNKLEGKKAPSANAKPGATRKKKPKKD